jgi:hypothetical protein
VKASDFSNAPESFKKANPAIFIPFWDKNELQSILATETGNHESHIDPKIQRSEPKQDQTPALDGLAEGTGPSLRRARVRFTGFRCRPLDPDNFAGGCKDLLDGLRHSGLIPGDEPWKIIFETEQKKVRHRKDEKTVIEIEQIA